MIQSGTESGRLRDSTAIAGVRRTGGGGSYRETPLKGRLSLLWPECGPRIASATGPGAGLAKAVTDEQAAVERMRTEQRIGLPAALPVLSPARCRSASPPGTTTARRKAEARQRLRIAAGATWRGNVVQRLAPLAPRTTCPPGSPARHCGAAARNGQRESRSRRCKRWGSTRRSD